MIVYLIKPKQMHQLNLPDKVKGQYWITDTDENGKTRELTRVEEIHGQWVVHSSAMVKILADEKHFYKNIVLEPSSLFNLKIGTSSERVILFAVDEDTGARTYEKYVAGKSVSLTIGRSKDQNIVFDNGYVSNQHAILSYDGDVWEIQDQDSTNGTYVNSLRVEKQCLKAGDLIYIMGLKIVVGYCFLAVNNPGGQVKITAEELGSCRVQPIEPEAEGLMEDNSDGKPSDKSNVFFRPPRFFREIKRAEFQIDPPPQPEKMDTVPMALMLGPSITMGMTSVSTAFLTVNNVLGNGGSMTQAMPALLMAVSMLLGTVLWPVLTKQYERKTKQQNERERQKKYLAYLNEIEDEIRRVAKQQSEILHTNLITPKECIDRIVQRKENLWERVIGQNDFLRLRVGIGTLPLQADVKYQEKKFTMIDDDIQNAMLYLGEKPKLLENVPVSISLLEERLVGVTGEYTAGMNMLKLLILQMVSLHSYDELKLCLITDDFAASKWEFMKWIPHFWDDDKNVRFLAADKDEARELSAWLERTVLSRVDMNKHEPKNFSSYYVVISSSKLLQDKCEAFSKMLNSQEQVGFSLVMYGETLHDLPKETEAVIVLEDKSSRLFKRNDTAGRQLVFQPDFAPEALLAKASERIANIELDLGSKRFSLPNMITFLEMFQAGKVEHLNSLSRWKENNPTATLQTPVGVGASGDLFQLDLHEKYHGPHGLVAGMTGSGKSEFVITYILSLAVNYHPDEVAFILIDYKGGGLAGAFEDKDKGIRLPHLAGTITNLDGSAVKRALISIQSELRRRQAIFNEAKRVSNEGTMDIYTYQQLYRDGVMSKPIPHLFIISDEFAELKNQQSEFMDQLISTARIGRSLGVHLILATQKPDGVVDDQIWSNSKFRVCLKVQERADSQRMINCPDAAELYQTGRFYLQVGYNELFALGQSAWCGAPYIPGSGTEKRKDHSIKVIDHSGRTLINVKPEKGQEEVSGRASRQIVEIVKYLSELAEEENIAPKFLWLPPIPERIYIDELEEKYDLRGGGFFLSPLTGEYDDPFNQRQDALLVQLSREGNCLLYGSAGNGKSTFLTSLCYSLIKNHSAKEVNIYIMDFGSETLKAFEEAPQVGDVILSAHQEKTTNLLKMLADEIESRRMLFSEYGGEYQSYCRSSGQTLPNIVVLLNNYAGFAERYEDYLELFSTLTRDGVKYGVYFVVTVNAVNEIRYKTAQNFKQTITLQLNDASDYPGVVGKTEGLTPYRCKGRGLVNLGRVYEFQTAYCSRTEDSADYLRGFCRKLAEVAESFAHGVPVLPKIVNMQYLKNEEITLGRIPLGVGRKTLKTVCVSLVNRVIYPVAAQDFFQTVSFGEELVQVLARTNTAVTVVDSERVLSEDAGRWCRLIASGQESFVQELFADMAARNNDYKDAMLDSAVLEKYENRIIVIMGIKRLYDLLSEDGKEKLGLLMEKAEAVYRIHFIIIDSLNQFSPYAYEGWYKRHISGSEGLWIGDGAADQYMLKLNKITPELYEEIGGEYGYLIRGGRPVLLKLLSPETFGDQTPAL